MHNTENYILGLDLGTNSIGWAVINDAQNPSETPEIIDLGVRVNPLTTNEKEGFTQGKAISTNAGRTISRGMRRNNQRYKLRRLNLINILKNNNIINNETILGENGQNTTFELLKLRAKAAKEQVSLKDFGRILLKINKKRGYKSNRKAQDNDEGQLIDGMAIAKILHNENLTPGQLSLRLANEGRKVLPTYYRSDLQAEFDKIWEFQKQFHPDILTDELYTELIGKTKKTTIDYFQKYNINPAEYKYSNQSEKIKVPLQLRVDAISKEISLENLALVIIEINGNISSSSGLLGSISDRSKELYFSEQTIGEYLYAQLENNPHASLKNQVFYRQDYIREFETIWETQANFYPELTIELKKEIGDDIFYQRKLKSQKGLVSFCEFESKEIETDNDGKKSTKIIGARVAPKSSPLFQEFKIWQILNNILIRRKGVKKRTAEKVSQQNLFNEEVSIFELNLEQKELLFEELNLKDSLTSDNCLKILGYSNKEWEMNYSKDAKIEGNTTNKAFYDAYLQILEIEGYESDFIKNNDSPKIKKRIFTIFNELGIDTRILDFDAELSGKDFEKQPAYQLWHLLYSYESDDSPSGNERLYSLLEQKFGFKREHSEILANVKLLADYGSLSTKAIRKIYPYIRENKFSEACELAGYRHSKHSITKEEIDNKTLEKTLTILKKNSLRQPVVEKILNQMINVVNELIDKYSEKDDEGNIVKYHEFREIHIELARELKKSAKERSEMQTQINKSTKENEKITKILQEDFSIMYPTKKDIIKYRLWLELSPIGYRDLYTNQEIKKESLFSKNNTIEIEHIIPKARLFDDSFSNKTLAFSNINKLKGDNTAIDFISNNYNGDLNNYIERVETLYKAKTISKAKYLKLLKKTSEIGDGFIERDLRETQYIAKKAKDILSQITKNIVSTSGSITDKLREDWGLIDIMKELNLPKYRALGLTEMQERKHGHKVETIIDWTKRNDHRHHAMDALTVAFTKLSYIQYLNHLNARKDESDKKHASVIKTQNNEMTKVIDHNGQEKRVFKEPMPKFRKIAKEYLENILISHKAKNKVITININKAKNKVTSEIIDKNGNKKTIKGQITKTPRGQLHKETIYGTYQYYETKEVKISSRLNKETINKVANPLYKSLLLKRLEENNNDPKKAFSGKNSINKNPIFLDKNKTKTMPDSVKLAWLETGYSIRKDVNPSNFDSEKSIEKVLDKNIRNILIQRLDEYNGDPTKAFSNLDKNPIWLNKEKGISIKRVTITGVSNTEPIHYKKDHLGNFILNDKGDKIPVDYIQTGNNHHIAVYKDDKGVLQEQVISFYEAVERANQGEPIINKTYKQEEGWKFLFTMKQNEMFVFPSDDFNPNDIDLLDRKNKKEISKHLFRVQKISSKNYMFRHHLESTLQDNKELENIVFKLIRNLKPLTNIVKVRINHLGDIVSVGEY